MLTKQDLWDRCLQEASEGIMLADFDAEDVQNLAKSMYALEVERRRQVYRDKLRRGKRAKKGGESAIPPKN